MGSQPSNQLIKSDSQMLSFFYETDIQVKEECDNPLYGVKIMCLNNQPILASNDILYNERPCIVKKLNQKSQKSKISKNQQNKQNLQNNAQKQSNSSIIDLNYFEKILSVSTSVKQQTVILPKSDIDPVNQLKKYIMANKSLVDIYSKAQIKNQDFIKLKKVPIKKFYKFQQKIGEGSYGNVYKVRCLRSNQVRAIKSVKHTIMSSNRQKQFISEIDILRQLDHPNIVKLFEVYEQKSMYHVVTQYCMGGSIIDLLMYHKNYSEKIIRAILEQLLSALNYIHSFGIVHRDLKLENLVFLNKINQESQDHEIDVKLIDFGTAIKLQKTFGTCKSLVGTTSYMAPEIIDGYFNKKSDVWSAGVILYILLIGKSPFRCASKQETLKKIKSHQPIFDQPEWQNFSSSVKDLVKKMLTKNPSQRISAAQALQLQWFNETKSDKNLHEENKSLINSLSKYYRGNNLISRIESYLTFIKINQQERKKITEIFRYLDKDHNGTIGIQELREIYAQIHKGNDEQNLKELEYILCKVDKNKSGKIDLSQFTTAIYDRKKIFIRQYLQQAFDYFDSDGTGYLQQNQLQQLLSGCQKKQIQEILKDLDSNMDNKISKQQFLNYLMKKNFLYNKQQQTLAKSFKISS